MKEVLIIKKIKIEGDLHTHTVSSGHAYSTVDEIAHTASKRGIKVLAITDHGPNLPGGPHEYHFGNIGILPDEIYGVRVIKGIEANILDNGELDLDEKTLKSLDFVAAGLHSNTGHHLKSKRDYTDATIKAIENPLVRMITHPANLEFPIDMEKVVKAASKNNVIIELNASSLRKDKLGKRGDYELSIKLARLARKHNVKLSLNSDTHYHTEVGEIGTLEFVIRKAGLKEENILNSSKEKILDFLFQTDQKKQII